MIFSFHKFHNGKLTTNYTCFRGMSSAHAIFIAAVSVYLVASTDLFSDRLNGPITFRSSIISTSALGVLANPHLLWLVTKVYTFHAGLLFHCSIHMCVLAACFTGFCGLLHHWSCNDLLVVSFPWWNGICRWPNLTYMQFASELDLTSI